MITIDPISLRGFKDFTKTLNHAVNEANKETAFELSEIIKQNIRTGYDDPPLGSGATWDWISTRREEELIAAKLMPHTGLVAETQRLIDSVMVFPSLDQGFGVTVTQWYGIEHEFGNAAYNLPARPFFYPAIIHFKAENIPKQVMDRTLKEIKRL